jgi:uncharacterized repeat protein (TIGR01451 family)
MINSIKLGLIFTISSLLLVPVLLLPAPALADAPICRAPNLAIPDGLDEDVPGETVTDTITVSDLSSIQDLNVVISTTHDYVGDLIFTLTHNVDGTITSTTLISRPLFGSSVVTITNEPACSGDDIDVTLDDEAGSLIQVDCTEGYDADDNTQAYLAGGSYQPESPLNIFDNDVLSGTWSLAVNDHFDLDTGVLNQWCLVPTTTSPDLQLSKDDGGVSAAPGDVIYYLLSYSNNGDQAATGVTLTETVPAHTTFNPGGSAVGWNCLPDNNAGSTCTLDLDVLEIDEEGTATFAVTLANPVPAGLTEISNNASISSAAEDGEDANAADNSASDTTPVTAAPDMQISKTDGGITVKAGGTITYTLSYTNAGNQNATGVVITETVPANTSFKASGSTAGWSCTPNINAGSTCLLNVGAVAGGGATGQAVFIVTVAASLPNGVTNISNTARIGANGSDLNPANNEAVESTPVEIEPIIPEPHIYLPLVVKD